MRQSHLVGSLALWEKVPDIVERLLYIGAGALAGLGGSWLLQKKAFKKQRLDRAREKVYGPLFWELGRMRQQVSDLEFNPSRQVADRIRHQEHLEWMIESKELRLEIAELYDGHIHGYRDVIHNLIKKIHEKLTTHLLEQVRSTLPQIQTGWSPEKLASIQRMLDERMRDVEPHVRNLVNGLAWPVLRARLPDQEDTLRRRSYYQNLLALAPKLTWSNFDDYLAEATKMYDSERAKAEEAKKNLQNRIEKIQREFEKLLKPD